MRTESRSLPHDSVVPTPDDYRYTCLGAVSHVRRTVVASGGDIGGRAQRRTSQRHSPAANAKYLVLRIRKLLVDTLREASAGQEHHRAVNYSFCPHHETIIVACIKCRTRRTTNRPRRRRVHPATGSNV